MKNEKRTHYTAYKHINSFISNIHLIAKAVHILSYNYDELERSHSAPDLTGQDH